MLSVEKRRTFRPWVAMGFCAFLSLITIIQNLWLSIANHADNGSWAVVFLCFLPMCFLFVGTAISQMQGEVSDLRRELAKLHAERPA